MNYGDWRIGLLLDLNNYLYASKLNVWKQFERLNIIIWYKWEILTPKKK